MQIASHTIIGQTEEPFLQYALKSINWVDYLTVVNTSPSTHIGQQNKEAVHTAAAALGKELRYIEYPPDENGFFSFGGARNKLLEITDVDDFVFLLDSDHIHYPEWEHQVRNYINQGVDHITAYFYHLMVYKDIFQYSEPREILFKNYKDTTFINVVHEKLVHKSVWPVVATYHFVHYGYVKPQTQIFDRWKFYSDLEEDYDHYDGQDPNHIVSDRISVSKPLPVAHPPVVQPLLESYPTCPPGALLDNWESVPCEKVGLVLLTYNDAENLDVALSSLGYTSRYPDWEVLAIDMGSTDGSIELLDEFAEKFPSTQVYTVGQLLPLAETLNFGFNNFRQRHDIQYIGWIHPDMRFDSPNWLHLLWRDLQNHPKIGKICAANTRDNVPTELVPGQEQCFIIRKDIINKIGLFDEGYVGIGGYEDWDMNRRIMNHDGYKVMISPVAQVFHKGMATRERRNTTAEQTANATYYNRKWGTSDSPC